MSRVVDNRVVQMEFDNARFEKNVSQSLSTLDRLKAALSFKGVEKDTGMVENAFANLGKSMSAFEQIGVGILRNFGDKIANWATSTIKELSGVNNIIAGFSKFDQMTKSAATLNAQGFSTEEVEKQLERLNWFTDETSYNLTDMVDNISKFTATGQGLEESADAMMGIALWAATAGQNAGTASRAMYQLSQAMSGYMRKEDWKSVQNANMDMKEFRELALETGVRMGKLAKNADGLYRSLDPKSKNGAGWFAVSQFADYLTEGAWFTSDVMMEVYKTYTKSANRIYEWMGEHTGSVVRDAIEALGDELDEFSLKAFKAGQEARTWGDAVDSVKDALSTKWMGIFQYIFGNAQEATDFFTDLANSFYDIFVEPMLGLLEAFRLWKEIGGRQTWQDALVSSLKSVYKVVYAARESFENFFNPQVEEDVKKQAKAVQKYFHMVGDAAADEDGRMKDFAENFDPETAYEDSLAESRSKKLLRFSDRLAELSNYFKESVGDLSVFQQILRGVFSLFGLGKEIVSGFVKSMKPFKEVLTGAIRLFVGFAASISEKLEGAYRKVKENNTFYKLFSTLLKPLVTLKNNIKSFYNEFMPRFMEKWDAFKEKLKPVSERLGLVSDKVGGIFDKLKSKWENLFTNFDAEKAVDKVFKGLSKVKDLVYAIIGVKDDDEFASWLVKKIDDAIAAFGRLKENAGNTIKGIWDKIQEYFGGAIQWIEDNWDDIKTTAHDIFSAIGGFFEGLWNTVTGFFKKEDGTGGFGDFVQTFKDLGEILGKVIGYIVAGLKPLADGLKNTFESLSLDNAGAFLEGGGIALLGTAFYKWATGFKKSNILKGITEVLEGIGGVLDGFTHMLDAKALKEAAIGIGILVASLLLLISMPEDKLVSAATVLSIVITILAQSLKKLSKFTSGITINKEGFAGSKSGAGGTLLSAAFAILILAAAMKMIAKIPEDDLYKAATVILALVAVVAMMLKAIGRIVGGDGDKDVKKVFNGINSGNLGNNNAIIKFGGPVMTILAFALLIVAVVKASEKLAKIAKENSTGLTWAISIIGVLIAVMTGALIAISKFTKESENAKVRNSTWKTLLAMTVGIYLVALAFEKIATIDRTVAGPLRLVGTGIFILALIGMFVMLARETKGAKFSGMGNFAKGILGITAAVAVLAILFKMLAELPDTARFGDAIGAFVTIGVILAVLLGMSAKLVKTEKAALRLQKVAVALIGMSVALAIAAASLLVLSEIDGNKIGTALIAILIALGALAGIGAIGTALGAGLIAVGQFLMWIGAAVALAGVGFLACAAAIKIFSDSTLDMKKAGKNMMDFVNEILKNVGPTVTWFLAAALEAVLALIPAAFIAIVDSLNTTLQALAEGDRLKNMVDSLVGVITTICDEAGNNAAKLVNAVGNLVIKILNGIGDWAHENSEAISNALTNFLTGIMDVIIEIFSPLGEKLFGATWGDEGGLKNQIETNFVTWAEGIFLFWFTTKFIGTMVSSVAGLSATVTNAIGLFGVLLQMYSMALPIFVTNTVKNGAFKAAENVQSTMDKTGLPLGTIQALMSLGYSLEEIEAQDDPIVWKTVTQSNAFFSHVVTGNSSSNDLPSWMDPVTGTIHDLRQEVASMEVNPKKAGQANALVYNSNVAVVSNPTATEIFRAKDSEIAKLKSAFGIDSIGTFDFSNFDFSKLSEYGYSYEDLMKLYGG